MIEKEKLLNTKDRILSSAKRIDISDDLETTSISYWFSKTTIIQLSRLEFAINKIKNEQQKKEDAEIEANLTRATVDLSNPMNAVPTTVGSAFTTQAITSKAPTITVDDDDDLPF